MIGSFQRTGHINFEVFPKFLVRGVFRSAFEVRCDLPLSFPDVRFSRIAEVIVGHIRRFRSGPVEVWPREERARTPEVAQLASPLALPKLLTGALHRPITFFWIASEQPSHCCRQAEELGADPVVLRAVSMPPVRLAPS